MNFAQRTFVRVGVILGLSLVFLGLIFGAAGNDAVARGFVMGFLATVGIIPIAVLASGSSDTASLCTVCREPLAGDTVRPVCGHRFHENCFGGWQVLNHARRGPPGIPGVMHLEAECPTCGADATVVEREDSGEQVSV